MNYKKAPKRTRAERECVSRTYRELTLRVTCYDRQKKKEETEDMDFFGRSNEMELDRIIKQAGDICRKCNKVLLDYDVIKAAEVRYIMTDADFIKYGTKVTEQKQEEKQDDNQRSKKN